MHTRFNGSSSSLSARVETAESKSGAPKWDPPPPPPPHKSIASSKKFSSGLEINGRGTAEEDEFLKKGIRRHGFGEWTAILRDSDFKFQDGRTADSLKKRAGMKMPLA